MYCQLLQDSTLLSLGCETTFWQSVRQLASEPAFRNIGLLVVAVIGVGFAFYRSVKLHQQTKTAIRQADTSEAGLNIDRFQKSVDMLSTNDVTVRIAGITQLQSLAELKPKEYVGKVNIILTSFLLNFEEETLNPKPSNYEKNNDLKSPMDFYAAFLAAIKLKKIDPELQTLLCNLTISGVFLEDRNLSNSELTGSKFYRCYLQNTNLKNANLSQVEFVDCVGLTYAQLSQAKNVDPEFLAKLKADEEAEAAKAAEENSRS